MLSRTVNLFLIPSSYFSPVFQCKPGARYLTGTSPLCGKLRSNMHFKFVNNIVLINKFHSASKTQQQSQRLAAVCGYTAIIITPVCVVSSYAIATPRPPRTPISPSSVRFHQCDSLHYVRFTHCVSVPATGAKGRGFEPGQSDGFLRAITICSTSSFGWEVKPEVPCRKIWRHVKDLLKSHGDEDVFSFRTVTHYWWLPQRSGRRVRS
jgi:hypothetical protein